MKDDKKMNRIIESIFEKADTDYIKTRLKEHKIKLDRLSFYHNFVNTLSKSIYDTYFGREYIYKDEDIKGHFNWCFNHTCNIFLKIGVDFSNNDVLYDYFFDQYSCCFYNKTTSEQKSFEKDLNYWYNIFDVMNSALKFEVDSVIDIYEIFNTTIERRSTINVN